MVFEENGVLWKIDFNNPTDQDISIDLEIDNIGFISKYQTDWQWWYPTPSVRANKKETYEKDLIKVFLEILQVIL